MVGSAGSGVVDAVDPEVVKAERPRSFVSVDISVRIAGPRHGGCDIMQMNRKTHPLSLTVGTFHHISCEPAV